MKKNILVYAGPGVGAQSLANTLQMIEDHTKGYEIKAVTHEVINTKDWIQGTELLVFPGGADLPYVDKLHGCGTDNITEFVQNGGKFIGICAGAYFSADRIEFAKGDSALEVTGERLLKFFPGLVEGPSFPGYDHRDVTLFAGIRAAKLSWNVDECFKQHSEFTVYYNGGGHFVDPHKYSNVKVLANYEHACAIVECAVGTGIAILSGAHFEQDPHKLIDSVAAIKHVKDRLLVAESNRIDLARHLLDRLGIHLKPVLPQDKFRLTL